jgi:hypothetical protein
MIHFVFILLFFTSVTHNVLAHGVSEGASAFIISPKDKAIVTSPVTIKFGVTGILIAPAGINKHKAGHFHLLLDIDKALDLDEPIPISTHYLHFNHGELETTLELSPGKHSLQIVVGDEEHEPFEELLSKKIIIHVK